ncbi:MAG: hypothetical protein ACLTMP_06185 [Eggerthella lenta]
MSKTKPVLQVFDFVARLTMNDQGFHQRFEVLRHPVFPQSKMPDEGFGLSRKLAQSRKTCRTGSETDRPALTRMLDGGSPPAARRAFTVARWADRRH